MEEFYSQSPIYKLDGAYYAFFDGVYQDIDQTSGELTKQKADMNKRLAKEAIAIDIDERSSLPKISWPRYKGNRKNREWPCETSAEDFHKVQIGLANRIAPLIKGITVAVPRAEADDIAQTARKACLQISVLTPRSHDCDARTGGKTFPWDVDSVGFAGQPILNRRQCARLVIEHQA